MSDSDLMSTHSGDSSDEEGGATRSGSKERWRASSAPVESFSDAEGANEDGEWMFQIIGEEVDETGHVLYVECRDAYGLTLIIPIFSVD